MMYQCSFTALHVCHTRAARSEWAEPRGEESGRMQPICGSAGKDVFCGIYPKNPGGLAGMLCSTTDPGFAFGVFDTVLVLGGPFLTVLTLHIQRGWRVNFSAGRGRASRERDGLLLIVSIIIYSVRLYIAHSRLLRCSLITKEFSTNIIYALTYFLYQKPQLNQTDNS